MATVQESIDVNVPVRQAYNQWTQFEDFPRFMSGVDAVRQLDDTTVHFETSIAGVKREYDAQITVQEPDQRVTWESLNEPRNAGTVWFESLGPDETKVNVELTWEPESAVEKIGAAVGLDSRQVASDLKKFKKFIESRDSETGAWRESVNEGDVEGQAGVSGTAGAGTGYGAADDGTGYASGSGMDAVPGRTYESGDTYDAAATERPVEADPDLAVDAPYGDTETGEPRIDTRHTDTRRDETPDR
ncbi:SRPBCC family protein [Arthrobacter sp. ISL-5]|uniref:SRPBCC family protein n=1 Tax=Arthrobacter sp. ISL-5 TaxID=2819111 RepID=UPI001BE93BAE|nr:SRPBCC family protein [Arthrobacter sp. ISL-5]MBT2555037.1 SRPBCC family protein [Arthrobacter sp. ISL-5]